MARGLLQGSQLPQGIAQIVVGLGVVRLQTHSLSKVGHRFRPLACFGENNPKVVVRLWKIVPEAKCLAKAVDSQVAPA